MREENGDAGFAGGRPVLMRGWVAGVWCVILGVVVLGGVSGCGYHLGDIRPTPMRSVKVLAVPAFKNETYRPRLENLVTTAVIHAIQSDGTYGIGNFNQADAVVYGTIKAVRRYPIRSAISDVLQTTEYRLEVEAAYEVQDRVTGVVLKSGKVIGKTTFFPTGDLVTDERQALSNASQQLAVELTRQLAEGW